MATNANDGNAQAGAPDLGQRCPLPDCCARLAQAIGNADSVATERLARSIACLAPHDPAVVATSDRLARADHLDVWAPYARMARFLDPANSGRAADRFHRAAKANRPDLMPPHLVRDVLFEARSLQRLIQDAGPAAACAYLQRPELLGNRTYVPRFRALRHFARFNADAEYRTAFLQNCIATSEIDPASGSDNGPDYNQVILDDLIGIANLKEKTDTVFSTGELGAYPANVDKRIRASKVSTLKFTPALIAWRDAISRRLMAYWQHVVDSDLVRSLYGFSAEQMTDCSASVSYHVNEILNGPVLGPHYHSGHRFDEMDFPLLSAVYYPRTVPKNEQTKAGYLEFGRPEFALPFEPACVEYRPIAGSLIIFPAFAYHGVIPIDRGPRYSINLDVYLRPANAASAAVSEATG